MKPSVRVAFAIISLSLFAVAQKPSEGMTTYAGPEGPCSPHPGGTANLCIPWDSSFTVPIFDNSFGNGQANPADPCQYNDDDSANAVPLQFMFDYFGTLFTEIYINNNGNISFGQPFSTFTASGFPISGFPMIAPFWGDVDTRGTGSGTVWVKSEPNRFTIIWDHVGYYNAQTDKLSTFQLIITDGTDPLVGIGNNVCFCYDDMQWTTGSASGGLNGFGGTPATVGINQGNGIDFFQVGLFDQPGTAYDGPGGNNDGVDWLDGQTICFDASGGLGNQPPIPVNLPIGNKYSATVGVPLVIDFDWIPPEVGQNIASITFANTPANMTCVPTFGGPVGTVNCTITPLNGQVGTLTFDVTATDDDPLNPLSTTVTITINVAECFLVGGLAQLNSPLWGYPEDMLYVSPEIIFPVTMQQIPSFYIPQNVPPITFHWQVLMWNPYVFPNDPLKVSNRLTVTLGTANVIPSGQGSGVTLFTATPPLGGSMHTVFFNILGF